MNITSKYKYLDEVYAIYLDTRIGQWVYFKGVITTGMITFDSNGIFYDYIVNNDTCGRHVNDLFDNESDVKAECDKRNGK